MPFHFCGYELLLLVTGWGALRAGWWAVRGWWDARADARTFARRFPRRFR